MTRISAMILDSPPPALLIQYFDEKFSQFLEHSGSHFSKRPVWVLPEFLEPFRLLVLLEFLLLLERLQLLHPVPAFSCFCSRWVFFLPPRHPHYPELRHVICATPARYEPTLVLHGLSKESSGFKYNGTLFTCVHLNLSQRTNYIQHG